MARHARCCPTAKARVLLSVSDDRLELPETAMTLRASPTALVTRCRSGQGARFGAITAILSQAPRRSGGPSGTSVLAKKRRRSEPPKSLWIWGGGASGVAHSDEHSTRLTSGRLVAAGGGAGGAGHAVRPKPNVDRAWTGSLRSYGCCMIAAVRFPSGQVQAPFRSSSVCKRVS